MPVVFVAIPKPKRARYSSYASRTLNKRQSTGFAEDRACYPAVRHGNARLEHSMPHRSTLTDCWMPSCTTPSACRPGTTANCQPLMSVQHTTLRPLDGLHNIFLTRVGATDAQRLRHTCMQHFVLQLPSATTPACSAAGRGASPAALQSPCSPAALQSHVPVTHTYTPGVKTELATSTRTHAGARRTRPPPPPPLPPQSLRPPLLPLPPAVDPPHPRATRCINAASLPPATWTSCRDSTTKRRSEDYSLAHKAPRRHS